MNESETATWQEYRASLTRYIEAIDAVLAQGASLERRYEQFCRSHGVTPGVGEERLTSDLLSPTDRFVHRGLLDLTKQAYDAFLPSGPVPKPTSLRPIPYRHRI